MSSDAKEESVAYEPGLPTAALVQPDNCVFGEEFAKVKLLSKASVSHDTRVFTFGLPDSTNENSSLGLSTCACILARAEIAGDGVIRPYTPVSTNAMLNQFQIMVKVYPDGKMSQHMDTMSVGQTLEFKHIKFNVKIQYPFAKKHIGMLVGGTGVSPMIQALHAILGTASDPAKVSMLYGNRTSGDILAKDTLDTWVAANKERFSLTHVLSAEPEGSTWKGGRGFINKALIEAHIAPPTEDVLLFVCGPPPMYEALCGPRNAKELTGVLKDMGYSEHQVIKF